MTLDFIFKTCTGHDTSYWAERGDLDWFNAYANPRDDAGKGILVANWNHFPRAAAAYHNGGGLLHESERKAAQDFNWSAKGRKFQQLLEDMGYQLEWSDQTARCEHCDGCIRTDAQCYGDTAHYAILNECEMVCEECIRKDFAEEYLESLENNPRSAVHISGIDPAAYGYIKLQGEYEAGFHPGQNDDPRKIYAALQDKGYSHILFTIDDSGQFDIEFSVWHRPEESDETTVAA